MFGEHWTSAAHKIINKEKILFVSVSELLPLLKLTSNIRKIPKMDDFN